MCCECSYYLPHDRIFTHLQKILGFCTLGCSVFTSVQNLYLMAESILFPSSCATTDGPLVTHNPERHLPTVRGGGQTGSVSVCPQAATSAAVIGGFIMHT